LHTLRLYAYRQTEVEGIKRSITPYYDAHALEQLFRHKLLKMLLNKGAFTLWNIDLLMSRHHSGFNVHVCEPIAPDDRNVLESLAHFIIRCQFSQEKRQRKKAFQPNPDPLSSQNRITCL